MTVTDDEMVALLSEHLTPDTASAAVMRNGHLLGRWHGPPQPLLPVYSITKTHIAALVLSAVRAGRLALDEAVAQRCPDLPDAHRITLRQLLNHTAGLRDYGAIPEYQRAVAEGGRVWSYDEFADRTYRRGGLFAPGTGWSYANPGYALLVRIVESIWQEPLALQLRNRIHRPLGLSRTRLTDSLNHRDICPSSSRLLSPGGSRRPVKTCYAVGWVWHRLIVSDAVETVRFLDALLRRCWLGEPLTNAMMALVPVGETHPPWTEPAYGLGLLGELRGTRGPIFGHNGQGPGYSASAFHAKASGITVAVIAATEAADDVLAATLDLHDLAAAEPDAIRPVGS